MKEALPNVDFSDASLKYFKSNDENDIFIYFESWDRKEIEVFFSNVIKLKYQNGDFISNIYEFSAFECKKHEFIDNKSLEENRNYKLFCILDIYDFSVFEIIAEKISASIKGNAI